MEAVEGQGVLARHLEHAGPATNLSAVCQGGSEPCPPAEPGGEGAALVAGEAEHQHQLQVPPHQLAVGGLLPRQQPQPQHGVGRCGGECLV